MLSVVARTGFRAGRIQRINGGAGNGSLRAISMPSSSTRPAVPGMAIRSSIAVSPSLVRTMSHNYTGESTVRPEADKVLQDIAGYVHNYKIDSELAFETARLCLIDTIGCGLEALRFPECTKLLGPIVEGTIVPNGLLQSFLDLHSLILTGTRVPGTNYQLDPVRGAFNIGAAIRWLDFNDCFLAAECAFDFFCICIS